MSFWKHLEELRNRLLLVVMSIVIISAIAYYYSDDIIQILLHPSTKYNISFQVLTVTAMFMVKLGVSFYSGLIFGFPILIYHLIVFSLPAFKTRLKRLVLLVLCSSILFSSGILLAYYIMIPFLLNFFTSMSFQTVDVKYNFTLGSYLNYTMWTMFMNGIIFQMPIISVFGSRMGLLTPAFLQHYRRHSFIFFLIMSALITPPDPFSQLLTCIPFVLLYELSIIVAKIFNK